MFRKGFIFLIAILLTVFAFHCCDSDEDMIQLRTPFGEWELEGYAVAIQFDKQGGILTDKHSYSLEEIKSSIPLLLTLTKEGTFTGNTPSNKISGDFSFVRSRGRFSFDSFHPDDIAEEAAGSYYLQCLKSVTSYAVFEQKLHLFYTKDESQFLLFKAAN